MVFLQGSVGTVKGVAEEALRGVVRKVPSAPKMVEELGDTEVPMAYLPLKFLSTAVRIRLGINPFTSKVLHCHFSVLLNPQ